MAEVEQAPPNTDPEALCTRVVARVIEELSCIEIAPDSPTWTDLHHEGHKMGQLAVYRGRNGISRMVCASMRNETDSLDSHLVAVFTEPESLVPHLLVDAMVMDDQASFHADLLPRLDLGTSLAYIDWCYGPLTETREALEDDRRFTPGRTPLRQRATMTPWMALYSVAPESLDAANGCVQRYVDQWARLMKQGVPLQVQQETRGVNVILRSERLRQLTFSRQVDPIWSVLDHAMGAHNVDQLLTALQG